ncbi:hypothetical protein RQP46_008710 [Phenoliferia psychrophenolica]
MHKFNPAFQDVNCFASSSVEALCLNGNSLNDHAGFTGKDHNLRSDHNLGYYNYNYLDFSCRGIIPFTRTCSLSQFR